MPLPRNLPAKLGDGRRGALADLDPDWRCHRSPGQPRRLAAGGLYRVDYGVVVVELNTYLEMASTVASL
jgi:hypothetical protein